MLTIAVKMKLHRMSFQQQGYLGLKLNISRVLSLWSPSRLVSGQPSPFSFEFFASSVQALGLQDGISKHSAEGVSYLTSPVRVQWEPVLLSRSTL